MKNTYIYVYTDMLSDFSDSTTTMDYLKENDSYAISDPDRTVAKHVYNELTNMHAENDFGENITLSGVPSFDEIHSCIKNNMPFQFTSEYSENGIPELTASWNPETRKLTKDYMCGCITYWLTYGSREIDSENVVYIPIESFLAYRTGIPCVDRFYQEPFTDLTAAEKAMADMQPHTEHHYKITKSLGIYDKNELTNDRWYKINMAIIRLLKDHPEFNNDEHFIVPFDKHLDAIRQAANDYSVA